MCTLNPRGRLAVGPRATLKEIPLYEIPGAVHPKPVLVCLCARVCVCARLCLRSLTVHMVFALPLSSIGMALLAYLLAWPDFGLIA